MSNPSVQSITKNTWVKVATNVFSGIIHKLSESPSRYIQTYRLTGAAAPTTLAEGVRAFLNDNPEIIKSDVGIDVYIYCFGENGSVRVDL